jgi:hypothetical protein
VQVTCGVQRLKSFDVILAETLLKVSSQFVRSRLLSVKALLLSSQCITLRAVAGDGCKLAAKQYKKLLHRIDFRA